jgi:hypothetical protein
MQHNQPEWAMSLQVYWNEDTAWAACKFENYHPFDVPIVTSIDDLAVDVHFPRHRDVVLYGTSGDILAEGMCNEDGKIKWKAQSSRLASAQATLAIAMIGDDYGEAIALTGEKTIDELCTEVVEKSDGDSENPWTKRAIHLIDPRFRDQRNVWWARKVCLSLAKLATKSNPKLEALFQACPSAAIEFGRYQAQLDGTTQYYTYLKNKEDSKSKRVAVIVPTVPSPVRPYLESYGVADLPQTEMLASIATVNGVNILWVGGSCVDYGGELSRQDVREAVAAYCRSTGSSSVHIFLEGACSAGVGALGSYTSGMRASGIVLWSPVVSRRTHRWLPDMNLLDVTYPSLCLADEQVDDRLSRYKDVPIFTIFDHDSPGHGDRPAVAKFMEGVSSHNALTSSVWVQPPEPELPWGLRIIASSRTWMQWIKDCSVGDSFNLASNSPRPIRTVKDALLEGFWISSVARNDPVNSDWLRFWSNLLERYRGAPPILERRPGGTEIQFRRFDPASIEAVVAGTWGGSVPLIKTKGGSNPDGGGNSFRWGFRLIKKTNGENTVEILSDTGGPSEFPHIDILVDGCCSGAVWKFTHAEWTLEQVWR